MSKRRLKKLHFTNELEYPIRGLKLELKYIEYLKGLYGLNWQSFALPREMIEHLQLENPICLYCGVEIGFYVKHQKTSLTIDHMDPLELGGEDSYRNATLSCVSCNSKKNYRPFMEWLKTLSLKTCKKARKYYEKKLGRPPESFVTKMPVKRAQDVTDNFYRLARGGIFLPGKSAISHVFLMSNEEIGIKIDTNDLFLYPSIPDTPVVCDALIQYRNYKEELVEIMITTKMLYMNYEGKCVLSAKCHHSNKNKFITIDRITNFVDLKTGEIIEDIQNYLESKTQRAA